MKRELKNDLVLWCKTNAKDFTTDEFFKQTGIQFETFFEQNKEMCLAVWNFLYGSKKNSQKSKYLLDLI